MERWWSYRGGVAISGETRARSAACDEAPIMLKDRSPARLWPFLGRGGKL